MDLLSDGSSSSKDDDDDRDSAEHRENHENLGPPVVPSDQKKRKRGSVSILSTDQVSVDVFQRSIPHKRGHWSSHVLIPTPTLSQKAVEKSIVKFQKTLEKNGYSGTIVRHSSLHISLSKHFALQLASLGPFIDRLTERLRMEHATRLFVSRQEKILVNEERTRSFWGWPVQPNSALSRLIKHVDAVLACYQKPPYYDPPIYHISLASFPGNLKDLAHGSDEEDDILTSSDSDEDGTPYISVKNILCNFGTTKSYKIQLAVL